MFSLIFIEKRNYIPFREEKHNIIPLKEDALSADKSLLFEKAHAFNSQYLWARKCAEIAYNMLIEGKKTAKILFNNSADKDIKGVYLTVSNNSILPTTATFTDFDSAGFIYVTISANEKILAHRKNLVISKIYEKITHEFSHGNVFWNRSINAQPFEDADRLYAIATKVITDENIDGKNIFYRFCYACYATYYQEVQALVSQTFTSLLHIAENRGVKKEDIDNKKFLELLAKTNTYYAYSSSLEMCKLLESSNGIPLKNKIIQEFEKRGYNMPMPSLNKKIKEIYEISNKALRLAYNNAYQWLFDSFD